MLYRTSVSQKQRIECGLWEALGRGPWGDVGQRVQVFSYKMSTFLGSNPQYSDYSSSQSTAYVEVAESRSEAFLPHTQKS